ncbi:MAG: 3-isopropylmalate dehydrogenase [Fusobacteriaceae bacterium]
MNKKIAVIKGDGIGPEIVSEAIKILDVIAEKYNHSFSYEFVNAGGCSIDLDGSPLPDSTLKACLESDSVLLGAVGGPKWDNNPSHLRPEKGLLELRKAMNLFSNIRPIKIFKSLNDMSPLKQEIVDKGIDLVVVRELTGGVYFGKHSTYFDDFNREKAEDIMSYSSEEIERVTKVAFQMARKRNFKVCSIDKANVLDTSKLWRKIVEETSVFYPDVEYSNMLVDNAAMQLIKNPSQFDIILTENMFGDILSDEASMITGSIGLMPSSSLGDTPRGLYEPIHGSAPDIAGQNLANPIGTILSVAMMLKYSFNLTKESEAIEQAVNSAIDNGFRTSDIWKNGLTKVTCSEMGDIIAKLI